MAEKITLPFKSTVNFSNSLLKKADGIAKMR